MKIGILICGHLSGDLANVYGQYSNMIVTALQAINENIIFSEYDALNQQLPDLDECDGYIVTGSVYNAYDNEPWILGLIDWVQRCEARRAPLVGICFGHQVIARALGGTVEKSNKGWGLGNYEVNITTQKRWMNLSIDRLRMLVSHQDQVITVPRGVKVIASSDFCPNFMLAKDNHLFTVQGHPEFSSEFLARLVDERKDLITEQHYLSTFEQLKEAPDSAIILHWIDAFFVFNMESIQEANFQKVG
ncbi:GMP synthase [Vibrio sp. UCD-FRSSP16_10]|uniref:type 1 glutamine amidotransferase n=1 Tax=unclassified Vibrio TaxID=2614977 RepID=UPI0007FECF2D|nr:MULTISPECIES: gamma-glutamyl-gamma-aminobutyrate hydrolase family protein [unclassified Vibrio]OBT16979.1 GMP synthase [Vibrio sp. UCD-FRSSP16_30]OBT21970.1 GMP synthase [Vibrio sp. UCD-FRSSP16_10]